MLIIEPTTLVRRYIILRPPSMEDIDGLSIAARDGEIWNNRFSQFPNLNEIEKYIQEMLELSSKGSILPFIERFVIGCPELGQVSLVIF